MHTMQTARERSRNIIRKQKVRDRKKETRGMRHVVRAAAVAKHRLKFLYTEKRVTTMGLDDISTSTTLESNKSHQLL